jgi:hypothetical protein
VKNLLAFLDACPVCLEVSRARREWISWLAQAAPHEANIADLLPTCPSHVWLTVATAVPELTFVVAHHVLNEASHVLYFALRALHPPKPTGRLLERVRATVHDTRARRRKDALGAVTRPLHCNVCHRLRIARDRALTLLPALLEQSHYRSRYEAGHGLCLKHVADVLARPQADAVREFLLHTQAAKLACVQWETEEQRRKSVWFGRPEARGSEGRAWLRALARFSGTV